MKKLLLLLLGITLFTLACKSDRHRKSSPTCGKYFTNKTDSVRVDSIITLDPDTYEERVAVYTKYFYKEPVSSFCTDTIEGKFISVGKLNNGKTNVLIESIEKFITSPAMN